MAEVTGRDEPKGGNEGGPDVVMRVGFLSPLFFLSLSVLPFIFRSALKDKISSLPFTGTGEEEVECPADKIHLLPLLTNGNF